MIASCRTKFHVEAGLIGAVFGNPRHAYTRALLGSIPGKEFGLVRPAMVV